MEDYSAYHLIKNTSGLGSGSDESVWRELTVKNAIVIWSFPTTRVCLRSGTTSSIKEEH